MQKKPAKKAPPPPPPKSKKKLRDDDYDEEEEEKPRDKKEKGKKSKKQRSPGATVAIAAILIVIIVGGVGSALYFTLKGDGDDRVADNGNNPQQGPPPGGMGAMGGPVGPGMSGGRGGPTPPGVLPPNGGVPTPPNGGTPTPPADTGKKDPPKPAPDPVVPVSGPPQISRSTIYNYVLKSTAWILTKHLEGGAMGTGELIDRDNRLILTNYHVVEDMVDFVVFFPAFDPDNKLISARTEYLARAKRDDAMKGKVVAHDKTRDLALIQLDRLPEGAEALPFTKADPKTGDNVHSIGNPGASGSLWVYTRGMVRSVYNKEWVAVGGSLPLRLKARVVETDSPINPGDSGGPCVNDQGELVGVTESVFMGANAIAIFVAYNEAENFVNEAFQKAPLLAGKKWARSQRPTLVASGGGDTAKLPALVAKLGSPDPVVRGEGAEGLALLGPDATRAIPELVKALADKNDFVRRSVTRALRLAGQPSAKDFPDLLPDLLPSLDSTSPDARAYVLAALALLGGTADAAQAAPAVLRKVDDPDAKVRLQAMRALGRMAGGDAVVDKDALTGLEKGLQDADKSVRGAAAESLATSVPSVRANLPKLTALLKNPQPEVRTEGAKAIARLGEKGKPAVPELLDAARSDNRELRKAGFVALNAVNATPQEMLPVLRTGLKDEDVDVRRAALVAAGKAKGAAKDLVPVIVDSLADSDVRIPALKSLAEIGPDAAGGAQTVANLLVTEKAMRMETLSTLEAMKLNGTTLQLVLPRLTALFEDEKQEPIREKVAEVLAAIGKPLIPDLLRMLADPNADKRSGAAATLAAMGPTAQSAAPTLSALIQREPNAAVKEKEIAALRKINGVPASKP